jgi:hypothetical protein
MLMDTQDHLGRGVAMSAGHLTVAMRAELGRLLAASRGDKRKALAAGLSELHTRKILHAKEATELAAIMEMFFAAPDGHDPKLAHRASTYFQALSVDFDSSPAALAIASVISSLTSPSKAAGTGNPQAAASRAGDAAFGGFGAVVGAGIGWGIEPRRYSCSASSQLAKAQYTADGRPTLPTTVAAASRGHQHLARVRRRGTRWRSRR